MRATHVTTTTYGCATYSKAGIGSLQNMITAYIKQKSFSSAIQIINDDKPANESECFIDKTNVAYLDDVIVKVDMLERCRTYQISSCHGNTSLDTGLWVWQGPVAFK